jgi:hypothetical protein
MGVLFIVHLEQVKGVHEFLRFGPIPIKRFGDLALQATINLDGIVDQFANVDRQCGSDGSCLRSCATRADSDRVNRDWWGEALRRNEGWEIMSSIFGRV